MARNLITSLHSLATNLLPSITASAQAPSSSSNSNNSQKEPARAVEEDLKRLIRTLERIKATLYDAEEREIIDCSVKLWLKELKKVAYDAEDVLSEYRYEVTRVQVEARKFSKASSSHKRNDMEYDIVQIPDDMVDRLNKIKSQFDEIAKDREALRLRESDGVRRPNSKILRAPTGHMVDEASIFGREAEIKEVISFLLSEKEKSFSIISIVGKGGLGKTTIAQLIYKNLRVSRCFDLFGWVCVSEEFDVRRLIKGTIESISKTNCGVSELSPLQEVLAETVKGKTMLLVLDDVWNENESLWELFRVPFKEAKMVRILVTTRNKKVADIMETTTYFSPTNLPESSCWQLFQHYAFSGTSDTVPTHLVDMGRDIMRKCGGLPLPVKSIASLLRHETYEQCWRDILESDLWEANAANDIFPALHISYAHLPAHLRPCFLLCSMYPKDGILIKKDLIDLWISHGYIESRGQKNKTEIGVEYYEELKERSFLDEFSNGAFKYCKLHDIIHDLARLISENENYSVVINQPHYINEVKVPPETYHLYVEDFAGYAIQFHQQNLKGLRTLLMNLVRPREELEDIFTKFEALRVLKVNQYYTYIPHSIFKLKHLTYLSITSFDLETLPSSIGLLYNLQTLILHFNILEFVPESIGDLANLQFLHIQSLDVKNLPKSLSSLSSLQKLVIKCNQLNELPLDFQNFRNLRELTIYSRQNLALPKTIGCLSRLEELNFSPFGTRVTYAPYGLVLPEIKKMAVRLRVANILWLKDMKGLQGNLSIEGLEKSNLLCARMAKLKSKCKLESLELCWDSGNYIFPYDEESGLILSIRKGHVGCSSRVDDVDFSLLECLQPHPNLKKLRIRRYPSARVPEWVRNPSSFHSIQEVFLECCINIHSLPFGKLHTLKHLIIHTCSSIRVLQLEQLSSQLEKLQILECGHLEMITGLGNLNMLVALKIFSCKALKSLSMVESTELFGNSSHEMPHNGRQSISSLTRLEIIDCKELHVLPDGLIPSGPCYVRVYDCGFRKIVIGHIR